VTAILDTGPLVALADRRDPHQRAVQDTLEGERGALVVPAPVTAEVDHLVGVRVGASSRRGFLEDLAAQRFHVACLEEEDHRTLADLDRLYADMNVGLADLSIVVLAQRFRTRRVVTFDERHFRAIRPLQGGSFRLLPADG
jgi:predicted nucleic acid-binding protein